MEISISKYKGQVKDKKVLRYLYEDISFSITIQLNNI